jgi:predicted type IV restriction endonuclease
MEMSVDFIDQINGLASVGLKQVDIIKTEEAAKNSLVLPFINTLGFNIFDPAEVVPEYSADFGTKIACKCDYAIFKDGQPIILFECKWCGRELEKKDEDQLRAYFAACGPAKFGVVTNGIVYSFFSDLDKPNLMDEKPFLRLDLRNVKTESVEQLKRFTKIGFKLEELQKAAGELKHTKEIMDMIAAEFHDPTKDFVYYFVSRIHPGKVTASVHERFAPLCKKALKQYISDRVNETLKVAIEDTRRQTDPPPPPEVSTLTPEGFDEQEMQLLRITQAILCEIIDPERLELCDSKTFKAIRVDGSKKRPIYRLYGNGENKAIGLINSDKTEERIQISKASDLYQYAERLRGVLSSYMKSPQKNGDEVFGEEH